MALASSPLSQVCKGIRTYLDGAINGSDRSKVSVVLSTPAETASTGAGDSDHRLNLFFYRFEPAGLFPDILPGETGWMRAFCLVTPFSSEEDSVGPGENDLRLVGEVSRIFHEKPIFDLDVDGERYHLQVILQSLALDQLNQLWSTQGDTVYRPSLLYEISLMPVVPIDKTVPAPLTGALGLQLQSTLDTQAVRAAGTPPVVVPMVPDTRQADWTPAVALVYQGTCALSLLFQVGSPELATFVPQVWLAGEVGSSVALCWETWEPGQGWQPVLPSTPVLTPNRGVDPESVAEATVLPAPLPFNDRAGQMLLYAERSLVRPTDGTLVQLRSNPLLITLYTG
ncbi:MAG: Pvc16 family protein [Desulfobulbus sp.]|nr:Pvc16 family protein [Desulfobulbus sp.]